MRRVIDKIADRFMYFVVFGLQCTTLISGLCLYYWAMYRGAHLPFWFSNMPLMAVGSLFITVALYTKEEMRLVTETNHEMYIAELVTENRELKERIRELKRYGDQSEYSADR